MIVERALHGRGMLYRYINIQGNIGGGSRNSGTNRCCVFFFPLVIAVTLLFFILNTFVYIEKNIRKGITSRTISSVQ